MLPPPVLTAQHYANGGYFGGVSLAHDATEIRVASARRYERTHVYELVPVSGPSTEYRTDGENQRSAENENGAVVSKRT